MYDRDHMDQVLATFGLILFFNESVRMIWGPESQPMPVPGFLDGSVEILPDAPYPVIPPGHHPGRAGDRRRAVLPHHAHEAWAC